MELYQTGIIDKDLSGGLELTWGNYAVVEKLLFMTAAREGFGDVIADSAKAVATGKYPPQALSCRMAVKGLFQSDPHDSRILKAFALGLAVATRGMDHLRNRVTLEINARINDDKAFKSELYGGDVAAAPNDYQGKEYAVRRCEDVFAVGDAVGMCRFDTQLFNSPSLPGCAEFADQLLELTGVDLDTEQLYQIGRNITALERMINARLGLTADDDTLPDRWFDEPNDAGPFKGEKIDRTEFAAMKQRFYKITGLNEHGVPDAKWHQQLAQVATGFAMTVALPKMPRFGQRLIVIDQPPADIEGLRTRIKQLFPEISEHMDDYSLGVSVNAELLIKGERGRRLENGDHVEFVPVIAGG
jgi:aldehyde:ferredoxin oxidoreductase